MTRASQFFRTPPDHVSASQEARFFSGLKTANATFKRTEPGRLAAIDARLVAVLAAHGATVRDVLDCGISSGTTTMELIDALAAAGHEFSVLGTDRSVEAMLVDLPFGCHALVERGSHVLQYEVFGYAVRPWRRRLDSYSGMAAVQHLIERSMREPALTRARDGQGDRVALISPRLRSNAAFDWIEDDITVRNPALAGRFDLIRAANLLNRHYFEPAELDAAIANVLSYLKGPGAWLLVLRTHGAADHRGTLWRVAADGTLTVVERFGSGSEVEQDVMRLAVR